VGEGEVVGVPLGEPLAPVTLPADRRYAEAKARDRPVIPPISDLRPLYSGGPTVSTKYEAGSVWLAL
jgi:hypothetical protein